MTKLGKVVVLGAAGQLGRDLLPLVGEEAIGLTRADLDLAELEAGAARLMTAARRVLEPLKPQIVVNCAAYNFVDRAEEEPELAFAVNALGVRKLAEVCRDLGAMLVQFSSDYVFGLDPGRRQPYLESDTPGPINVYGASKLAGEGFVRSICPRHLVIRTCGLYGLWGSGGKGGNFVETMLRLAGQGKPVRVVNDQRCTPSFTADVAAATRELILNGAEGLRHVTNQGSCTWYELAKAVFELSGLEVDLVPITSRDFAAKARRPAFSPLGSEHADTPALRPWREALADYLSRRPRPPGG